jgi:cytochrome oxidase Cu insertion factor (SCO1/SenC/PrrC family)
MKSVFAIALGLLVAAFPASVAAQPDKKKSDENFAKEKPAIGDTLPDLIVYSPDGKEVKTSSLRGQYAVLTFGCLT